MASKKCKVQSSSIEIKLAEATANGYDDDVRGWIKNKLGNKKFIFHRKLRKALALGKKGRVMQLVPLAVAVAAFIVVVAVSAACNAVEIVVIVVAVYAAICRVALEVDQRRYLLEPDSPTFELQHKLFPRSFRMSASTCHPKVTKLLDTSSCLVLFSTLLMFLLMLMLLFTWSCL